MTLNLEDKHASHWLDDHKDEDGNGKQVVIFLLLPGLLNHEKAIEHVVKEIQLPSGNFVCPNR